MHYRAVDFNLVMPLRALLEEKSVSKAAERLRVSQPSLSASLAKLRLHFADPLLERRGRRYELTPLAAQLLEHSYSAELSLSRLFGAQPVFDPASTEREFSLFVTDYGAAVLAPMLIQELAARAPKARLHLHNMGSDTVTRAPDSFREYDGLVMPHGYIHGSSLDLFRDRWLLMVSVDNTEVTSEITLEQLSTLSWVFTYNSATEYTLAARHLELLGIQPRVEVVAPSFLALPFLIANTNRVALVQEALGNQLAGTGLFRLLESPIPIVELQEAMWWHPVHDLNPEHLWFRSVVGAAARRLVVSGRVQHV